jgi:hypothetical protein
VQASSFLGSAAKVSYFADSDKKMGDYFFPAAVERINSGRKRNQEE